MARKNLLSAVTAPELTAVNSDGAGPLRVSGSNLAGRGALGAVTRSIDGLAARAEKAQELEARLAAGQTVVELDPAVVDPSFMRDRMAGDEAAQEALVAAMAEQGQVSPILVRPHPAESDRYQVAFGHRRLAAARALNRTVRAIVRAMSDRDLVVAQGQENSARTDLSFIERAGFALRLEAAGYDRPTIMAALATDKTTVSRLISVAAGLPAEVVAAIGPAPGVGRDRWLALVELFASPHDPATTRGLIDAAGFSAMPSDDRFARVQAAMTGQDLVTPVARRNSPRQPDFARVWSDPAGRRQLTMRRSGHQVALLLADDTVAGFGEFLAERMDGLLRDFLGEVSAAAANTGRPHPARAKPRS